MEIIITAVVVAAFCLLFDSWCSAIDREDQQQLQKDQQQYEQDTIQRAAWDLNEAGYALRYFDELQFVDGELVLVLDYGLDTRDHCVELINDRWTIVFYDEDDNMLIVPPSELEWLRTRDNDLDHAFLARLKHIVPLNEALALEHDLSLVKPAA